MKPETKKAIIENMKRQWYVKLATIIYRFVVGKKDLNNAITLKDKEVYRR